MTPTELPQGSPSRLQRALKALVWMSVFVGALALLLFPTTAEHRLNQAWLALTTDWFWPESVTRPAYQVDSTRVPDFALVSWSDGAGAANWSSPAHGQLDFGLTGFSSPVDYRLLTLWQNFQRPVAVLEPPAMPTFYWQPSRAGYKPLIHQTSIGTLLDASLVAASGHHQWHWRPGVQYESSARYWPADWRGAMVLLEFAVPEPVRHAPGSGADFTLKSEHELGIQWVREVWALTQGLYLFTPWWLTLTAAFALVFPWVLVNTLKSAVLASALFAGVWAAANWVLVLMLQWWLPLWPVIVSVLLAIIWLLRQRKRSAAWLELMSGYKSLASQRVEHFLYSGQLEAAQKLLLTSPWLSQEHDAIYKVAQAFERKRQYQAALDCYQHLFYQNPDYRDAGQRYQALMAMTEPKAQWQGNATVRTMVAPAVLEQPEIGRYRLLKELGRGAMGVVYEAVDPKIERPVALKVVNLDVLGQDAAEDIKKRFYREARAAGCLNHPNIVTVFDVGEERDLAYIAMDLIRGVSLQQHLAHNSDIQPGQLCEWLAQAAEALDYAHNNGIIHRDIKPANLLLDERSGELKVSDFGVARVAGSDQTATGIILGSPNYMSPEQIKGEELTPQTDIYSLGVTLYRALAGRLPFQGETLPALAYAVLHEQQESPRRFNASVTPALVRIVNRAMQKNPAERYATAGEMAQALHRRVKAD